MRGVLEILNGNGISLGGELHPGQKREIGDHTRYTVQTNKVCVGGPSGYDISMHTCEEPLGSVVQRGKNVFAVNYNGTKLNGKEMEIEQVYELVPGSILEFHEGSVRFELSKF